MSGEQSIPPFGAAVYRPDTPDRMAMLKFADWLRARGVRVGGIVQAAEYDAAGGVTGVNAIDVATGEPMPITHPVQRDDECGLDVAALAETTGIIRRAIEQRVDLVLVEKFGEQEQSGRGLMDEILQTIATGIPLLVAVPAAALPLWQERTGELGSELEFSEDAFRQWWRQLRRED